MHTSDPFNLFDNGSYYVWHHRSYRRLQTGPDGKVKPKQEVRAMNVICRQQEKFIHWLYVSFTLKSQSLFPEITWW